VVGIVVVSHSARLAEGVVELAREMAGDVRIEAAGGIDPPAAGEPRALGTDAVRVMEAIEAAHGPEGAEPAGVLVLMDLGSAVLSAETAVDLLDPEIGAGVRLAAAPLVEGAIAAAVAAQAGQSLDEVEAEARGGLGPKLAHLGGGAPADAGAAADEARSAGRSDQEIETDRPGAGPWEEARFVVTVAQGLHARPAARFVRAASELDALVEVENATTGSAPASATSLNAIATLGVREGHEVIVRARGPQAAEAIGRLRQIATERLAAESAGADSERERLAPFPRPRQRSEGLSAGADSGDSVPPGALRGIPSSPGIAIAPLRRIGDGGGGGAPPIAEQPSGSPDEEWAALERARAVVRDEIAARRELLAARVGGEEAEILDALALALDDRALLDPARAAIDAGRSAARGWADATAEMVGRYRALADDYQRARADDLDDVATRVLAELAAPARADAGRAAGPDAAPISRRAAETGAAPDADSAPADEPFVLLVRDLTPLDAAGLDPATVRGIATAGGGPTSHGAILARALGVPAVVGLGDAALALADGTPAILDGIAGLLLPDPSDETRATYLQRRDEEATAAAAARAVAHEPALTRDRVRIEVAANIGGPRDAADAVAEGADAVGLMRTEFAFLDRDSAPSEDEQVAIYRAAAEALDGRPLVIRTLDAGADKPLPYLGMPPEQNPFLGVRGLRLGLARPELLATQLRAIVRVAAELPNVKLMFPMVAVVEELRAARALLDGALEQTSAEPREGFEVGVMVEVPAAALIADHLAAAVDFLSLGTNDLTQYVLAAERGNEHVAALADGLHPAVLRLIGEVCRAAEAHGRWVGVCGELGADPAAIPLLTGLGVRELSVAAPSIPAVKAAVRALDTTAAGELAERALAAESAAAVRALVVESAGADSIAGSAGADPAAD
jgi:phosphoenolpyruvate-protein phosphotransferase/dihydroxyacetone kinase phosphotransfer subunit